MKTKILSMLIITIIMAMSLSTFSLASTELMDASTIKPNYDNIETENVLKTTGRIVGLIRNVSVIAGVVLISILGLKFMIGSVEERAEYKKSFMPLIIGAVIVMAATQIATLLFSLNAN